MKIWNKYLPLQYKAAVKEASRESDRKASRVIRSEISLYKCSDLSGEIRVNLVKRGNIEKQDLEEHDSFIIEAGPLGIWIWLGRKSNEYERKEAMKAGIKFIEVNKLSGDVSVSKVIMGAEPEEFKSLFVNWL